MASKGYTSFADFEREQLRAQPGVGWALDELNATVSQSDDFDLDPFEACPWEEELEDAEKYFEDE